MSRRSILGTMVAILCALAARRAHALRDPTELSVGGSGGAHDAHITCGPDARVRHASGGLQYQRVFQAEGKKEGVGVSVDVRAGAGSTTITKVVGVSSTDPDALALEQNELGRSHWLGTFQAAAGYDWRTFALRGGVGYFGFASATDDKRGLVGRYYPLPVLDMRIGRATGFRGELGVGAPPIPGLARWYSLYGFAAHRFEEGGEVGGGYVITFGGTYDQRMGVLFKGSVPITKTLSVGGFGMVDADDKMKVAGFNWTAGGGLTLMLDVED